MIGSIKNFFQFNHPPTELDILNFLNQFATLLKAGIPIIQSCEILQQAQKNISLRILIFSIKNDLLAGKKLFQSLQKYENYFDYYFNQLILIGETTGTLPERLDDIVFYLKKKIRFKDKIKQMCFYPCLIFFTAMAMLIIMLVFVIPKFSQLFKDTIKQLPMLTRFVFGLSELFQANLITILALLLIICSAVFYFKKNTLFRHYFFKFISYFPFSKKMINNIALNYFFINFSTLLAAGIPLLDALKILHKTSANNELTEILYHLKLKINAGFSLHQAMHALFFFPPYMLQMVRVGEESGMLEKMLNQIAHILEKEINQTIQLIIQFLEPLIMIILGVLIGGLIIAMYLPIFKLGNMM